VRLNNAKKIIPEDFPDDINLVRKLADVLNPFIFGVFTAISKQLTLAENLKAQVLTLDLLAGESTKELRWELNERPTSLVIGNILKSDNTQISQVVNLSWLLEGNTLKLKFNGLDGSTKYKITLVGQV
jgi:hypothetical protein